MHNDMLVGASEEGLSTSAGAFGLSVGLTGSGIGRRSRHSSACAGLHESTNNRAVNLPLRSGRTATGGGEHPNRCHPRRALQT
jgi:hypothetical protein